MKLRAIAVLAAIGLAVSQHAYSDIPGIPTVPPPTRMPDHPGLAFSPTVGVGYVDGSSGVTATGQYTYEVPIEVPPGRAGMQPDLSLRYVSRAGNGLLGTGWAITGMSQITRCPKTIATEGVVDGVDFDGTDRFCLDGEKLIAVSGIYGGHYSEYRTENDSFARVRSYGSNGPTSFEVWSKDGRIAKYRGVVVHRLKQDDDSYALVPDGDVIPVWILDEVRDRTGNTMRYVYADQPSTAEPYGLDLHPLAIEYTTHASLPSAARRRVDFEYDNRPDPYFEYQNGVRFETTKRLIGITTWAPKSQVDPTLTVALHYKLEYEGLPSCIDDCPVEPAPSRRSRLASISKCDGATPQVCTWERQFVWAKQTPTFDVYTPPASNADDQATGVLVLDLNGDARDDILYSIAAFGSLSITYARFGTDAGLGDAVPVDLLGSTLNFAELVLSASRAFDVDSDGSAEIYATFRHAADNQLRYAVLDWDVGQEAFVVSGQVIDGPAKEDVVDTVRIVDLDGDGRPDVVRRAGPDLTYAYQENVDGQLGGPIGTGVFAGCFDQTRSVDLDGDGRGQLLGFDLDPGETACTASRGIGIDDNYIFSKSKRWKLEELSYPTTNQANRPGLVLADVNGDGLKDVVHPAGLTPTPKITWNTGNGFGSTVSIPAGPSDELYLYGSDLNYHPSEICPDAVYSTATCKKFYRDGGNRVADVNGDGLEDIISFRGEENPFTGEHPWIEMHLAGRTASGEWGFTTTTLPQTGGFRHQSDDAPQTGAGWPTSQIGDFNGDGLVDIVQLKSEQFGSASHFEVLLQQEAVGDVIAEVWDAKGQVGVHPREQVFYSTEWRTPSVTTGMYLACEYPQSCIERGFPVVRDHYVSQGEAVGAFRRYEYDYENPRTDANGRGFLGFAMMRQRDPDLPSETITTFDNVTHIGTVYPYVGLPSTVTTIQPILEQFADLPTQPPPSTTPLARVTKRTTTYDFRSPQQAPTYFVAPGRWTLLEWEEKVELQSDRIKLLESPNVTVLRRRDGSSSYDDYGNVLSDSVTTTGGVRRTVSATYTNDTTAWLIGMQETLDVAVTNVAQVSPPPRRTEFDYDAATGILRQVRYQPLQAGVWRTTTFYPDAYGLVQYLSDATANEPVRWTYFAYDADRVFATQRYNDLLLYDIAYTDPHFGAPSLVQEPDGTQTTYQYDGLGRPTRVAPKQAGDGTTISYAGDTRADAAHPRGVAVTSSRDGGALNVVYHDELGRPWETATRGFGFLPAGWVYDAVRYNVFGSVIRKFRPGFGAHSASATVEVTDTLGRPVLTRDPKNAETKRVHSMFETKVTDPDGRTKFIRRDKDDRVVESAELKGGIELKTKFKYQMFDLLDTVEGPDHELTLLGYDAAGRRKSLDDPNRGFVQFVYNGFGELAVVTEPGATKSITYFRDVLGRIKERTDADGSTKLVWDQGTYAKGKLSSTLSPHNVSTSYEYDSDRLLAYSRWSIGSETFEFARTYDDFGRLEQLRYPQGFTVQNHYNLAGYLDKAWDPATGDTIYEVKSRSVDFMLGGRALGKAIDTSRMYDPATGRLQKLTGKTAAEAYVLEYDYYLSGNVKSRTDSSTSTKRIEQFGYDDLNRLWTWTFERGTTKRKTTYGYNNGGNLTYAQIDANPFVTNTFESGRPHLLESDGSGTYTSDLRGRQLTAPGRTVTYTELDVPRVVTITSGSSTQQYTIDYDAFGDRVRNNSTGNEVITLDGLYERRKTSAGTQHIFYVQSEDGPVAQVAWTATEKKTQFLDTDPLGSIGFITDAVSGKVTRLYYDPFGRRVGVDGSSASPPAEVKLGFTGQRHDDELGLINMRGRVYDPKQRRFLTADPYVSRPLAGQSHNRYAYALNNPLRYVDPSGHTSIDTTIDVGEGEATTDPMQAAPPPKPQDLQNEAEKKKIQQAEDPGSDNNQSSAPPPVDQSAVAPPPQSIGGDMNAPDAPGREPEEHPDESLLRSFGETLAGMIPTIPKNPTAGDLAWRAFGMIPAAGVAMGALGQAQALAKAIASPDLNDAAAGAGELGARVLANALNAAGALRALGGGGGGGARAPGPGGSGGARSLRSLLRDAGLPGGSSGRTGPFRYRPPEGHQPGNPLPRGPGYGYLDRHGNNWQKGPYHGDPALPFTYEWDVQLSPRGLRYFAEKGLGSKGYVDIRPDGWLSH